METYRMTIVFNDGIRPYHNRHTVGISDKEQMQWIQNYADRYVDYWWFEFIEYLLVNTKSGAIYKGKIKKNNVNNPLLIKNNQHIIKKVGN